MIFARWRQYDERRVRDFFLNAPSSSETAFSLSSKLKLNRRRCRRALEQMVDEGVVKRREFGDIEPIYYRYPTD